MSNATRRWLAAGALAVVTVVVYARVHGFEFLVWDDYGYIVSNPYVSGGLTADGAAWAMTTSDFGYWAPVTWFSHMLDVQLWGLEPSAHHLVNVALHVVNAVVLLILLESMTGRFWPAAFVAAIFAIHPLNVESVAWVAERKNLLSGLFWLLAIWSYGAYTRRGGLGWYALTVLSMALGLMAKATLVTLPFVLLLLDYWPLGARAVPRRPALLLLEKLPLFALSAGACGVTYLAQHQAGAVVGGATLNAWDRVANALVSYVLYVRRTIWPDDLAALYPFHSMLGRSMWSIPQVAGAALLLLATSLACIALRKRHPYLFVGWFWFAGVLVPMIGLVQVGNQAMADRHMYVPIIGLLVATAWTAPALASRWTSARRGLGVAAILAVLLLAAKASLEVRHWRNTLSLFERTLERTTDNWLAMNNVAWLLATCPDDAVRDGRRAVALAERACEITNYADHEALDTLAAGYAEIGRFADAVREVRRAIDAATRAGQTGALPSLQDHLAQYENRQPMRSSVGCPR